MSLIRDVYRDTAPPSDTDYDSADVERTVLGPPFSLNESVILVPVDSDGSDEPDVVESSLDAPAGSSSPPSPDYANRGWVRRDEAGWKGKGVGAGEYGRRKRAKESSVEFVDGEFDDDEVRGRKKLSRRAITPRNLGPTKSILDITLGLCKLGEAQLGSPNSSDESDEEMTERNLLSPDPDTPCPTGDLRLYASLVDSKGKNRPVRSFQSRLSEKGFIIQTRLDPTWYVPLVRDHKDVVQVPVYQHHPGHHEVTKYTRPRPSPRRPALRSFPQRAPGSVDVKHLQRRSPTSLLPRREKDTTRFVRAHTKVQPTRGDKTLASLRTQQTYQIRRRNLVNNSPVNAECTTVQSLVRWREILRPCGNAVGLVKTGQEIRQEILYQKVLRWLRLRAVRSHNDRKGLLRGWDLPLWAVWQGQVVVDEAEQEDVEIVLSALAPTPSEHSIQHTLRRAAAAYTDELIVHNIYEEIEVMEDEYSSDSSSDSDSDMEDVEISSTTSTSRTSSPPPEYVPPISLPLSSTTRARITSRSRLPNYQFNQYSNRSPSPPPPYNARTDRETLVQPIFVDDEDEEEVLMARIRPGEIRSPTPEEGGEERVSRMVGAFPEVGMEIGSGASGVDSRVAWEGALEVEEADEYNLDEAIQRAEEREYETRMREGQGALGSIARWIGGIWRR